MIKLGVNIDHVATVRQARRELFPDPVTLAQAAIQGGADGITAHLREDRRHIQDQDITRLKAAISASLNMEMAATPEITAIALQVEPAWCCLVPEKRAELTTEGGLDIQGNADNVHNTIAALQKGGIKVSLFVEPDENTVKIAQQLGADAVELHTGTYAEAWKEQEKSPANFDHELKRIVSAAIVARNEGLIVNAGHGVDYDNVGALIKIFPFNEFNIGFSIVARSLEVGMLSAVQQMKEAMREKICVES